MARTLRASTGASELDGYYSAEDEAIDLGNEFPVMDPNNWNPSPLGECG